MSIINRVLNDIEEQSKVEKKQAVGSLEPIYIKELDNSKYLYLIIGMLSVIILGLLWWLFSPTVTPVNSDTHQQATNIAQPNEIKNTVPKVEVVKKQLVKEEKPKEVLLKKEIVANKLSDGIDSSRKDHDQVILSENTKHSAIATNSIPEESNLKKTPISKPLPTESADSTLTSSIVKKDNNVKKSLSITPVKMTDIAVANLKLKQGIKAQQNGNIIKAQKMWQEALTIKPDLHEARIQLAASFYGANELPETMLLIAKAVREFPQYDGYRLMAAQIYYQEKQPEKALVVLNSPFNKKNVATENLVLAGSLAQQLQQWPAAQSNYQVLVNRDINNSQWVLGLAIAHDALGEKENAHRYYSRLMNLGNVDQAIREYARKRSSILKTSMNARGYNG